MATQGTQGSQAEQAAGSSATVIEKPTLEDFKAGLRGELLQPGDAGYDAARTVYNAMIARRPALIARCADAGDVIAAVNYGRERGLAISIRGGSHNVVGFATNDGGLVIDLSRMRGVRVDPEARTARAEGGATWGDVDHATHAFGLATPSGIVSTTGVAGLTLGGGVGNLTRTYGLSCDNLLSADVVLADGRFVTASATKNPDLFWALRGGGGNFGVVTSFEFKLHPVKMVYGGPIFFPMERAPELLRFYRDFIAQAPGELNAYFGLHVAPPAPFVPEQFHFAKVAMIFVNYVGPMEQAEEAVRPIRQAVPPALDLAGPAPFPAIQRAFDDLLTPGLQHYWKAHFIAEVPDEAIAVHAEHGALIPNFFSGMHMYPVSGAAQQPANDATAWGYRDARFVVNIVGIGPDPEGNAERTRWVREYWEALRPYAEAGAYVNFLGDEGEERIRETYRGNYGRLVEVKTKYDPANLFRLNQNIKPAGGRA